MNPDFKLPAYTDGMLWLTAGDDFQVQVGNSPLDLSAAPPEMPLLLRWGHPEGTPMMRWSTRPDRLTWRGDVRVGGHVECTHLLTVNKLDLLVVEMTGYLIPAEEIRLPSLQQLRDQPFERAVFRETEDTPAAWYAFLLPLDSPLSDFAHQAITNGNAIDCYGVLASDKAGFHQVIGMPLLLESLTLYPT